jgi:hypothetical protein
MIEIRLNSDGHIQQDISWGVPEITKHVKKSCN